MDYCSNGISQSSFKLDFKSKKELTQSYSIKAQCKGDIISYIETVPQCELNVLKVLQWYGYKSNVRNVIVLSC